MLLLHTLTFAVLWAWPRCGERSGGGCRGGSGSAAGTWDPARSPGSCLEECCYVDFFFLLFDFNDDYF